MYIFCFIDLTNNVEDAEDTIVMLLARMETLEAANSLLQETVDVLSNAVTALQNSDNTTNDRLQEVEIDLQGKCNKQLLSLERGLSCRFSLLNDITSHPMSK